ncbi:MAG: maleylpyruvate isomerase family mycothiol-dependent enzyme [Acidimicrobiales bacterium]|nr:maleylpyruvate isomerase family mycothiol-dependent enzyme [Acidimicrobiales bacterium]
MGMTVDPPDPTGETHEDTNATDDLIAAFSIDAVGPDEAGRVEAMLASSASAAAEEANYRIAGAEFAASILGPTTAGTAATGTSLDGSRPIGLRPDQLDSAGADRPTNSLDGSRPTDLRPPRTLRDRVLKAALQARRPARDLDISPVSLHRIEAQRLITMVRDLAADDWTRPMDPPEFAGWTVGDTFAHIAAAEGLFAQLLGLELPEAPETGLGNEERTASVQARHRTMHPGDAVDEYETLAAAIDSTVSSLPEEALEAEIEWWGAPMPIASVLVHRAFETWTHHDDIRRAVGLGQSPPPPESINAMSRQACEMVPLFLATIGQVYEGETAHIVLTGEGGGSYLVDLGFGPRPATEPPVFELRMDAVDFCRAIANRIPPGGYPTEIGGDAAKARALVSALPNLAGL